MMVRWPSHNKLVRSVNWNTPRRVFSLLFVFYLGSTKNTLRLLLPCGGGGKVTFPKDDYQIPIAKGDVWVAWFLRVDNKKRGFFIALFKFQESLGTSIYTSQMNFGRGSVSKWHRITCRGFHRSRTNLFSGRCRFFWKRPLNPFQYLDNRIIILLWF